MLCVEHARPLTKIADFKIFWWMQNSRVSGRLYRDADKHRDQGQGLER